MGLVQTISSVSLSRLSSFHHRVIRRPTAPAGTPKHQKTGKMSMCTLWAERKSAAMESSAIDWVQARYSSRYAALQVYLSCPVSLLHVNVSPCYRLSRLGRSTHLQLIGNKKKKKNRKKDRCGSKNIPVCSKEGMFFSHQTRKKKMILVSMPICASFQCSRQFRWSLFKVGERKRFGKICSLDTAKALSFVWKLLGIDAGLQTGLKKYPSVNTCREYLHQQTTDIKKKRGWWPCATRCVFLGHSRV